MHSSRMHTGRLLTVCRSLLLWGGVLGPGGVLSPGVVYLVPGGVPGWGVSGMGCVVWGCLVWGVSGPGGVWSWGRCLPPGRCLVLGGVCFQGVSTPGVGIPACTEADTPPVNRMINRCKNITLATILLRPVIKTGNWKNVSWKSIANK